eukprot:10611141-Karenia_brevis.AAC.1
MRAGTASHARLLRWLRTGTASHAGLSRWLRAGMASHAGRLRWLRAKVRECTKTVEPAATKTVESARMDCKHCPSESASMDPRFLGQLGAKEGEIGANLGPLSAQTLTPGGSNEVYTERPS